MRKIAAVALAVLAAACASEKKDRTIQYGAAQAPDPTEQSAVANAELTLGSSLAYQASTEPSAGAAGLADQLVSELGGYTASAAMPDAASAKLAARALHRALDTGGIDPGCVVPTDEGNGATKYTWTGCRVQVASTDPYSGDTTTMDVTIDGWLKWEPAVRTTTWSFLERLAMTMTSGADTIEMHGTAGFGGSLAAGDATLTARTGSTADVTMTMRGPSGNLTVPEVLETKLTADLEYQLPFCITGGKLEVAQYATVMGQTQDQGWDFVWTGCGAFTVAHGS